jgi:hypothetical protein
MTEPITPSMRGLERLFTAMLTRSATRNAVTNNGLYRRESRGVRSHCAPASVAWSMLEIVRRVNWQP